MTIDESMKKPLGILSGLLLAVLVIYILALARNTFAERNFIGRSDQQIYTITIGGEGKVTAIPDIAEISLGLETKNKQVEAAQKENTTKMNTIIDALTKLGVEKKDIATSNYSIYPQYDYVPNTGQQILRGYIVNQSVVVKVRNLDSVGKVVEAAGSLGANQVGGLNFTIDEPEVLKQQARIKALENAQEKARSLAKVAGVKIGKIVSFNEVTNSIPPMYKAYAADSYGGMGGGGAVPSIEPGSQEIIIDVSVTYEVL